MKSKCSRMHPAQAMAELEAEAAEGKLLLVDAMGGVALRAARWLAAY